MDYSSPSSDDSILSFNPFLQSSKETHLPTTIGNGKKYAAPKQKAKLSSLAKVKASTDTPSQYKGSAKTKSCIDVQQYSELFAIKDSNQSSRTTATTMELKKKASRSVGKHTTPPTKEEMKKLIDYSNDFSTKEYNR